MGSEKVKREIEKLCLTENQYRKLGTVMMVIGELLLIAILFLADYSFLLGMVFSFIGLEFAFVGYSFIKVAGEISKSEDEEFIDKHKQNSTGQRNVNFINAFIAIILILCIISVVLTVDFNKKNSSANEQPLSEGMSVSDNSQTTTLSVSQTDAINGETHNDENYSVVFATNTGKCYHYSQNCAGSKSFAVTIDEALKHNLEPCKKCVK